jgi:hypothetical protein
VGHGSILKGCRYSAVSGAEGPNLGLTAIKTNDTLISTFDMRALYDGQD